MRMLNTINAAVWVGAAVLCLAFLDGNPAFAQC